MTAVISVEANYPDTGYMSEILPLKCVHCSDDVPLVRLSGDASLAFCCDGCEAVYSLLRGLSLDSGYYALKAGKKSPYKPLLESGEDYSALDEAPFRQKDVERPSLDFFLEGIHCSACLWILERLPELSHDVLSARLDMGRSLLRVQVGETGRFENVAKLLLSLGYRPHPVRSEREVDEKLKVSDRATLRRMGVSAFSAMNVMIYSVSLYSGADGYEGALLRWLAIGVALPALTYGAWPFYLNAWNALRSLRISIDLPIAIAFVGGFAESLRQAILGTNLLYLDSLTSLVFLMLASRYALSRLERAEVSKAGLLSLLLPAKAIRWVKGRSGNLEPENTRSNLLREGDLISITTANGVPVDGKVESGQAWIDLSFLSGESRPVEVGPGDWVYAGSRVMEGSAHVRVSSWGKDTRLGEIERKLEASAPKHNKRTERSDRWAMLFLASVIGFAFLLFFLFGFESPNEALRRSLSILIIACPCALALATPLTLARAYRLAASRGILLRDPDALDRMLELTDIIFDKTGTITRGMPSVRAWRWVEDPSSEEKSFYESVAYSLEIKARHPFGKAIVKFLENRHGVQKLAVEEFAEIAGKGVKGKIDGVEYTIQAANRRIALSQSGAPVALITLDDEVRPEAGRVLEKLGKRGLRLSVLSGDSLAAVARVAGLLGIDSRRGALSPEEKRSVIESEFGTRKVLMIGDGINDVLAFRAAHVSVAFNRGEGASIESALSGADVAILKPNLNHLIFLLDTAVAYRRTLTRNAIFSAVYNLTGASFAALGLIHPLVAAVAMPLSALTVYFSTVVGLRSGEEHL